MMNDYKNIKLEKGLYGVTGKTFTQVLGELDPDSLYKGTALEGLDPYERQLKRFDIKVGGKNSDKVEKFFASTESAVLFPEYVRRTIKAGMDEASILGDVCAAVSYTDSIDFRGLTVTNSGDESGIDQREALPVTTLELASSTTALSKFARVLSCSYESIRKQRLEALSVILKNLGARIARAVNKKAVTEALTGAGSLELAGNSLTYSDLAAFWAKMKSFDMTTMVCSPETMAEILALEEMKYCVSDYMSGSRVKTPYGVTIVKCPDLSGVLAVGIDRANAIEAVFGTDVIVDFNKLISTQCDEIACSVMVGFSKINSEAVAVLKKKTA